MKNKRIVILGAGLGGLFAAYFLQKKGLSPSVFEKGNAMWMCLSGEHRVTAKGLEVRKGNEWVLHKRE